MTSSVYQAIGERGRYSFAFLTRTLNCSIDYVSGRLYPASVSITGPPLLYTVHTAQDANCSQQLLRRLWLVLCGYFEIHNIKINTTKN